MNQTLKNCIDDFVEGHNVWEIKKAEIINKMALTLEKLHFAGEYQNPLNTISGYIRKELASRGVSEHQLDHVSRVLPSKYKNENLVRNNENGRQMSPNSNNNNNINNQVKFPAINIYELKKEIESMSTTERQEYAIQIDQEDKHIRNNMKARKDVLEYVCIKEKTPLPRYKKVSAEIPPEHLQGPTLMYHKLKEMSATVFDIYKYLEDIAKSIYEFPPEQEMAERCAHKLDIFDKTVLQTIKMILVPYTDKKWSADWIKWCDIHLTRLEQSKNYAGSKHALETGEYAVKWKDGTQTIFTLDRGITREQVGDKEPELFEMAQQMILGLQAIQALHECTYETFIDEEYDDNGNPILKR